jgi:acyl-CoA synthetase (AMP-forming)/AMP-acid ligase II
MFEAQVRLLRATYGMQPGEVDLATFPLFALFDPALGMTCVVPRMDFTRPAQADPASIIQTIRDHGCTNMFASPALVDRLARYGIERGVKLDSLKRAVSAGAPISPAILERFTRLLPEDAQVFTPYGATEALPVASIGSREILEETAAATARGAGVCVGRPVEGMTVRIIAITDESIERWSEDLALPPKQIGEIVVAGPVATREYFGKPEATRAAQIPWMSDEATKRRSDEETDTRAPAGCFHRMGDVGYFDDSGRLWMCGRKAHRVETAEGTLFTVRCEAVFNQHPKVFRTALVGVNRRQAGHATEGGTAVSAVHHPGGARSGRWCEPVLCVELERRAGRAEREVLRQELLELGSRHTHTRTIQTILFHPRFPVDVRHNAKIFREKLALWAAVRL